MQKGAWGEKYKNGKNAKRGLGRKIQNGANGKPATNANHAPKKTGPMANLLALLLGSSRDIWGEEAGSSWLKHGIQRESFFTTSSSSFKQLSLELQLIIYVEGKRSLIANR